MFILFIIFISIKIGLTTKEFVMEKRTNENNTFSPYTFKFNFKNEKENNYSFIFDTSSYIIWVGNNNIIYNNTVEISTINGELILANEICNDTFCWFETDKQMNSGYIGVIGISNKNRKILFNKKYEVEYECNDKNYYLNYYLNSFDIKKEERYINFIQKNNNEARMIFGENSDIFKNDNPQKCQCKRKNNNNENEEDNNIFWCCEISSIKIGDDDIYSPSNNNEFGIFAINEEYIIAPRAGITALNFYEKLIKDTFGVNCTKKNNNTIIVLKCDNFNYYEMQDLSFIMKGNMSILALSSDLFKVDNDNNLELKLKVNNSTKEHIWYLGEPIVKNYNLLLNYTNLSDISLIIIPSSLNGFILVTIAIILGFLLLIIFIISIIYILKKGKNNNEKNTFFSSENSKKENTFFSSFGKNSTSKNNYTESIEKIEEEELEETKNNINNIDNIDNINNINNIETNSFNNLKEINKDDNNIGNGIINDSFTDNNIIKKNNNNNLGTPTSVEFSLNDIGAVFDDNDDELFIKPSDKK